MYRERNVPTTMFRKYFNRGDIPIARAYNKGATSKTILMWRILPKYLDYGYYLPIFFDG